MQLVFSYYTRTTHGLSMDRPRLRSCFFTIEHGRRRILHFNVTEHPTGPWIVQQLRETYGESCPYRYAILDRDIKFGQEATDFLTASDVEERRAPQRCIGNCRCSRSWFSVTTHATTHGGGFFAARICKLLILKDWFSR